MKGVYHFEGLFDSRVVTMFDTNDSNLLIYKCSIFFHLEESEYKASQKSDKDNHKDDVITACDMFPK